MKSIIHLLFLVLFVSASFSVTAQDDNATSYHVISYMKVEQSMHGDYLDLEKAWKKIHQAKKDADQISGWALSRVISPAGSEMEYNYITRNSYRGEEALAKHYEGQYMPENWTSLLTADEIELVMNTGDLRKIVKTEVWATMEGEFADDYRDAKIHVFNYFDHPEGKGRDDHFRVERDIWQPVHKARVAGGELKGWVLLGKVMPGGSAMPYHDATVDIYEDMEAMLTDQVEKYFEKVHAGKKMEDLWDETMENTDLVKREVRMNIDRLK